MVQHGATKYSNEDCRCVICRTDWANYIQRRKTARKRYVAESGLPPSVEHGYSAYSNWGCRCPICTEANRVRYVRRSA